MNAITTTVITCLLNLLAFAEPVPLSYSSPDGARKAIVVPLGRDAGAAKIDSPEGHPLEYECRVEIYTRQERKIWSEDFGSLDHDHGRGVAFASWSPDSKYFVFSTVSSGGHHPWQYFTYAYSRSQNDLYILDRFVGEVIRQKFTFAPPDILSLTTLDRSVKDSTEALAIQSSQSESWQATRSQETSSEVHPC